MTGEEQHQEAPRAYYTALTDSLAAEIERLKAENRELRGRIDDQRDRVAAYVRVLEGAEVLASRLLNGLRTHRE